MKVSINLQTKCTVSQSLTTAYHLAYHTRDPTPSLDRTASTNLSHQIWAGTPNPWPRVESVWRVSIGKQRFNQVIHELGACCFDKTLLMKLIHIAIVCPEIDTQATSR